MYFIALDIVSSMLLYLSWRRSVTPIKVGLFFAAGASIAWADIVFTALLRWYTYAPHLLHYSWSDNYLGVLLGDVLFVPPMVSAFMSERTGWKRMAIGASLVFPFLGIEYLFVRLGLFQYRTWRLWMTLITFPPIYVLVGYGANRLPRDGYRGWHRRCQVIAMTAYLGAFSALPLIAIFRQVTYQAPLPTDPEMRVFLTGMALHYLPFMLFTSLAVLYRWVERRWGWAAYFGCMMVWVYLVKATGWRQNQPFWPPIMDALTFTALAWVIWRIDGWMAANARPAPAQVPPGAPVPRPADPGAGA